MPRQEINKKSATKALAEAAAKPGQLRRRRSLMYNVNLNHQLVQITIKILRKQQFQHFSSSKDPRTRRSRVKRPCTWKTHGLKMTMILPTSTRKKVKEAGDIFSVNGLKFISGWLLTEKRIRRLAKLVLHTAMTKRKKGCLGCSSGCIILYHLPQLNVYSNSGGNHLNNFMFSNIAKQYLDMVDVDQVVREFAGRNERRMKYFGKY